MASHTVMMTCCWLIVQGLTNSMIIAEESCPPGTHQQDSSCILCEKGKYEIARSCKKCEAGTYSNISGASQCYACEGLQVTYDPGQGNIVDGMSACTFCPDGTYLNPNNRLVCTTCGDEEGVFCTKGEKKPCSQAVPNEYYILHANACSKRKDSILSRCSKCSAEQYIHGACTPDSDTVCRACSRCDMENFVQYEYSKCAGASDTVCQFCNSSAGDMELGSGKCNPCPPGTYLNSSGRGRANRLGDTPQCSLCPHGKYNAEHNASYCSECAQGFISLSGASRCVRNCSVRGEYSADGIGACKSSQGGFKTMISAWESTLQSTISAAAPIISYDSHQIAYDFFLGATRKPHAYSSEILLITYQASWSVAGNGYDTTEDISDGKGSLASFALITSITMDNLASSSGNTQQEGGKTNHGHYLITEHDASARRGYLRMFSLMTVVDSEGSVQSFEGEAARLDYHPQVTTKHLWIHPEQSVFDASTGDFLVIDIEGGEKLIKIRVDYNRSLAAAWKPFIASCFQLRTPFSSFNPLSMALFHMHATGSSQGLLVVLDGGKIVSVEGHRAIDGSTLQQRILCGGGTRKLSLESGNTLPCSEVDLSSATQVLLTAKDGSSPDDTLVIYVMLTAFDYSSSAVAQITVPANNLNGVLLQLSIAVFWSTLHADAVDSTTSIPLHFIPNFSLNGVLKALYWVESKGIISRLGGGAHLSGTACLCDAGLYCDASGQCMDAPLGTYTDGPWTTEALQCPVDTLRKAAQGKNINNCTQCPAGYEPPKPWYCESTCQIGLTFDEASQACILGCGLDQGLYNDPILGRCMPCWWGSQSTAGTGKESCMACLPGYYGTMAGVCVNCPQGTSTWTAGATICTPDPEDLSLTAQRKLCADGLGSVGVGMCPVPSTPTRMDAILGGSQTAIVAMAGSNLDGALFLVSRPQNQSEGSSLLFHLYDTVRMVSKSLTMKTTLPDIIALLPSQNIFHHMQWCESCLPVRAEINDKGDVVRFLYHAANRGSCVYRTSINPPPSTEAALEIFSGDCDATGQPENGLLPNIHSMALMETDQLTPILYISTITSNCAEVYALSLYDKKITHFVSQDILKYPTVQINICFITPLILASARGTRGYLYAAVNNKVYAAQLTGEGARAEVFLTNEPVVQIEVPDQDTRIASMTIQQQTFATYDAHHIIVATEGGNIHSIPPSASTAYSAFSTVVTTGASDTPAIESMSLIGRRIWYADKRDDGPYQILLADLQGCVGGFVIKAGVCMQAGRGLYTAFDGSLQSCPQGTYGIKAGGALNTVHCQKCPDGTFAQFPASAFCKQCPAGSFSDPFGISCVTTCPLGTYRSTLSCVPCQAGYSTFAYAQSQAPSSTCLPCPEGSYSNKDTAWQCTPCADGFTSPKGAHKCVRICSQNTCAADGEHCVSLTKDYKTLSQIFMGDTGQRMIGLAVDAKGGVFYTNGNSIRYYFDDCPSYSNACDKSGTDLLPPSTYSGYSFSAMAVCGIPTHASHEICPGSVTPMYSRKLYIASLTYNSIFELNVCQNADGVVDAKSTLEGAAAGLIQLVGLNGAGFADGPFVTALMNYPADLDLNAQCTALYVSDFYNHRIRLMNLTSQQVTTVAGTGNACWKMGGTTCHDTAQGCNPNVDGCASMISPVGIGLSPNEDILYVAGNSINSLVSISRMKGGTQRMVNHCSFVFRKMQEGTVPLCNSMLPNSKSCMLMRPFDAVAVSDYEVYVGVTQGITKIYSEDGGTTFMCEQVAGNYFDISTTGFKDGIRPTVSADTTSNSLVNIPYKLAYAKDRGILYFADFMNGAVRRILVRSACVCPVGMSILPSAASCYNPSPSWSNKPLPSCKAGEGLYALEGDSTCFRKCADALQQGLSIAPCLLSPKNTQFGTLSYTQLLGDLMPPHSSLHADWYGFSSSSQLNHSWNSIFSSTGTTSPIYYKQGRIPGRAPYGRDFVSLTFSPSQNCWFEEKQYRLRPVQIVPGLWYPCGVGTADACSCPENVNIFEAVPLSQAEREAQALAPKRWQALRNAAASLRAQYMDPKVGGCTAEAAVAGTPGAIKGCIIQARSVFMILGSPDEASPTACPASASEGGPCFPTSLHIQKQASSYSLTTTTSVQLTTSSADWGAAKKQLSCYLGWPAHYYCPNGYTWVAPSTPPLTCNPVSAQVTCLSCLPGTFSFVEMSRKSQTGGPYKCQLCMQGTFASAVGSSMCHSCPMGKYASAMGSTACDACGLGEYTVVPMAYTSAQCVKCLPGTGNCTACTVGTYQSRSGQLRCLLAQPGYYTSTPNASEPTPCAEGYYQDEEGRSTCMRCPIESYTHGQGSTSCEPCNAGSGNCTLAVNNVCGNGCGLNSFWNQDGERCEQCPANTLNAYDACAMTAEKCWVSPRRDYIISNGNITLCPPGSEANSVFDACRLCDGGTYSDTSTQGCKKCPAGKFSPSTNATFCIFCDPGKIAATEGRQICASCEPGTFSNAGTACSPCPAGQKGDGYGKTACTLCDYGKFTNVSGMTECDGNCDASQSYFSIPGDTACRFCEGIINTTRLCQGCGLGSYFDDPSVACVACPAGRVNLNNTAATDGSACLHCESPTAYASSSISCTESSVGFVPNQVRNGQRPCPPGTIRNASMTECTDCPEGTYAKEEGGDACSDCRIGYYAPDTGRSVCSLCESGTIASRPGSTACTLCPAGTKEMGGTTCQPCPNNTYSTANGSKQCFVCDDKKYSLIGATSCSYCPAGKAMVLMPNGEGRGCGLCPPGSYLRLDPASTEVENPFYSCRQCELGKYQAYASGATNCSVCDSAAGWVALSTGQSACKTCEAGQYAASPRKCEDCEAGNYSSDGRRCVECPAGNYSTVSRAAFCPACPAGSYKDMQGQGACTPCTAGTFADSRGATVCKTCPSGTFNPQFGQSSCRSKRTACKFGQHLNFTAEDPVMDHDCVDCAPCARDQLTIFLTDAQITNNIVRYTVSNSSDYFNEICPGNTAAPLYQCMPNTPPAGQYVSVSVLVGSAAGNAGTVQRSLFAPCEDPKYNPLLAQWVVGKDIGECYVGCLYGINSSALTAYQQKYGNQGTISAQELPESNIFLKRMLMSDVESLCLPCPLATPCPVGKFRPRGGVNPDCGPPCAIQPQCSPSEMLTGCTANCTILPSNAGFVDGSRALGSDACPWMCMPGFRLSDNRSACLPCPSVEGLSEEEEASRTVESVCGSSTYILLPKAECLPNHTSADICKPCPRIPYGRGVGWDQTYQRCSYRCYSEYFLSYDEAQNTSSTPQPECRQCSSVGEEQCPVGYYLDQESCELRGETPTCKPCISKPMLNFTSNGGRNASKCRGLCPPGFHTVSLSTGQYFSPSRLSMLPFVPDAYCSMCQPTDGRTCLRSSDSACFPGHYKNLSVETDQLGSCLPCTQSHECKGAGYYAPPCTGSEVVDAPCLRCPTEMLKASDGATTTKQFIAYKDVQWRRQQVIFPTLCPRVCLNNFVRSSSEDECVSCKYLAIEAQKKTDSYALTLDNTCITQPGSQPSMCSFIFSHWNATPAKPWWDITATPWFRAPGTDRAGFCWACPSGMITGEKDTDLCTLLPGFISGTSTLLPTVQAIPSLPEDVSVAINALPSPRILNLFMSSSNNNKRRPVRRLLMTLNLSSSSQTDDGAVAAWEGKACPHGYYKPPRGEGTCFPCPTGSSTRTTGSSTRGTCMCQYGYYKTADSNGLAFCLPCPADTFRNVSVSVVSATPRRLLEYQKNWTDAQMQCTPCPPKHTTYGDIGATRCVCRLGMIMNTNTGECSWCPEGQYCPPCEVNETAGCPSDGIERVACFPGASSPQGSYSVDNCTCATGMVKRARPRNPSQFYCVMIPMGGELDAISGKIICKRGWRVASTADGSVTECALCSPGWYASLQQLHQIVISVKNKPVCNACPRGKYLSSSYGMGIESCTQCPFLQNTRGEGASSLQNCSCPSMMAKDPVRGVCIGCSPSQYVDPKNTSLCMDCPANALAQTGAASISQCLCIQGFYSRTVDTGSLKCVPCPKGTFSAYASKVESCTPCPQGSTTFMAGATKLTACGEDQSLCDRGYMWRQGVGCFAI